MATQIQWRRGNTAQTATFTGAVAEITVDTDKKTIVVHDGTTSGGIPLALESSLSANSTSVIAAFAKANAANVLAQAGSTLANTANTTADAAFAKANSANVLAQLAFDKANTDATSITATAGVYGNATIIPVVTLIANGRVSAITNTAIQSGSTSQPGILQLNDTITSTSTTQAATANAALTAYQLASADAVSFAIALG